MIKEAEVKKSIAYWADEILDCWLNIGKHEADLPITDSWSWSTRQLGVDGGK